MTICQTSKIICYLFLVSFVDPETGAVLAEEEALKQELPAERLAQAPASLQEGVLALMASLFFEEAIDSLVRELDLLEKGTMGMLMLVDLVAGAKAGSLTGSTENLVRLVGLGQSDRIWALMIPDGGFSSYK